MAYKSLPREQQLRMDPMITGFNPTDMYAKDHIQRVLLTFPGVFSGVGVGKIPGLGTGTFAEIIDSVQR